MVGSYIIGSSARVEPVEAVGSAALLSSGRRAGSMAGSRAADSRAAGSTGLAGSRG
jgi:hypothetical protein